MGAFMGTIKRIAIYRLLIKFSDQECFVDSLSSLSFHPNMYVYVCGVASESKPNITDYNPNQLEECWLRVGEIFSPLFGVAMMKTLRPSRIV